MLHLSKNLNSVVLQRKIDVLIKAVKSDCKNSSSRLYGCKLGGEYIIRYSKIMHSTLFEAGVIKIQSRKELDLIQYELEAVKFIRLGSTDEIKLDRPQKK